MTLRRHFVVAITAAALVATAAGPALAERNTGAFGRSSEAFKLGLGQVCADFAARANALDKKARQEALPATGQADQEAANFVRDVGRVLGCRI